MTAGWSTYRVPVKAGGGLLPGVRGERVQRTLLGRVARLSKLRGAAVPMLKASEDIDTRSVLHRQFAGTAGAIELEQYARNMLACDYALVARGRGKLFPCSMKPCRLGLSPS